MIIQQIVYYISPISNNIQHDSNRIKQKKNTWCRPKGIQQTDFTENLERNGNKTMFSIIGNAKETNLDFSEGIVRVL